VQAVGYRTPTCCLGALGPTTARSREQPKSTLAHDTVRVTVVAALSQKHLIIHVSAGHIQLVYASHSRLAAALIVDKIIFSP